MHLLGAVAPRSIVLIEDIDAAFPQSRAIPDAAAGPADQWQFPSTSGVTLSGLLNAIDGEETRCVSLCLDARVVDERRGYPRTHAVLVMISRRDSEVHI